MSGRNPQGDRFDDGLADGPQDTPLPASGPAAQRRRSAFGEAVEERDPFVDSLDSRQDVAIDSQGEAGLRETTQDEIAESAQQQAASNNEFVNPADIGVGVGTTGVQDVGIENQSGVANRVEAAFADESEFVEPDDVDADVSETGIGDVGIENQSAVASRVRTDAASDNEFVNPGDIDADVDSGGINDVELGISEQTVAARQFEADTALDDVGADDVTDTNDGFGLDQEAERELAREVGADQLSDRLDRDVDPDELDVVGEGDDLEVRL